MTSTMVVHGHSIREVRTRSTVHRATTFNYSVMFDQIRIFELFTMCGFFISGYKLESINILQLKASPGDRHSDIHTGLKCCVRRTIQIVLRGERGERDTTVVCDLGG